MMFQKYAEDNFQAAKDAWRQFAELRRYFLILSSLKCHRSFCRTVAGAHYLTAADRLLAYDEPIVAKDMPLLGNGLLGSGETGFEIDPSSTLNTSVVLSWECSTLSTDTRPCICR